jgi:hypothetical protein
VNWHPLRRILTTEVIVTGQRRSPLIPIGSPDFGVKRKCSPRSNSPSIAQILRLEKSSGTLALVMEFGSHPVANRRGC